MARTEKYVEEVLRNQTKGKKTRPPLLIRDVRFFLNSLDHSLAVMRSAGVAAQCQRKEEGEDLLLTIRIPKAKGRNAPAEAVRPEFSLHILSSLAGCFT